MRGHDLPLDYHRILLDDFQRVDHYDRAIRALVRPGDVVLDLGTGSGILALLAARRGARVHAIESMPVARLAAELAAANGLADRVTVHHGDAVTLPVAEPVDLVIGEFMGRFLVDDRMMDAVDAARRWLKPGGRFCPGRIRLRLAPVADVPVPQVDLFRRPILGLDLTPLVAHALQQCTPVDLPPSALLANPVDWHDWQPGAPPAPFAGEVGFAVPRDARLVGIAGFFDAELAPGITLSTAPGTTTHWGQVLFHTPSIPVRAGDRVEVSLHLLPGEALDFRWQIRLLRGGALVARSDHTTERAALGPAAPPSGTRDRDPRALDTVAARAFRERRLDDAIAAWEAATLALGPADDDIAREVWERLGTGYHRRGEPRAAIRAFLRALDGRPGSREKSLRSLVECAAEAGSGPEVDRWSLAYQAAFGPHPSGFGHRASGFGRREAAVARNEEDDDAVHPLVLDDEDEETTTFTLGDLKGATQDDAVWLIVLSGRSVGKMFRLQPGEFVIGRSPGCQVVIDDEGVSREHAKLFVSADGPHRVADLESRNGTWVEDQRVGPGSTPIRDGERIRIGPGTIFKIGMADELEQQVLVQLYHAATRDGLTGLYNKRFFLEQLEQEVAFHRRHDAPLSLIMLDLDNFKKVNTDYGHIVGDAVLVEFARRLLRACRSEDMVARFGGEEFTVILRQTPGEPAAALAERLRASIARTVFPIGGQGLPITISVGVVTRAGATLKAAELLEKADACMRAAKAGGRNRVQVAD